MLVHRPPSRALAPFVERFWYSDGLAEAGSLRAPRGLALPTGGMDLVLRLAGDPIRVFEGPQDRLGLSYGFATISGVRSSFYVRDTSSPSRSVGVHFRPGGAAALLR